MVSRSHISLSDFGGNWAEGEGKSDNRVQSSLDSLCQSLPDSTGCVCTQLTCVGAHKRMSRAAEKSTIVTCDPGSEKLIVAPA